MNKILLIIKREYLTRVRKKSFIILSLLAPLLMAGMVAATIYIAKLESDQLTNILVKDNSGKFTKSLIDNLSIKFTFSKNTNEKDIRKIFSESSYNTLLIIPENPENNDIELISEKLSDLRTQLYIQNLIEEKIRSNKLKELGIDIKTIDAISPKVKIKTIKIEDDGSEIISSTNLNMAIGSLSAFLIYMFIFIYGAMVMRGVIEEKTNRVVEIIISSVKPFQLMMGKIIGIAMVALTQFLLWIILGFIIISITQTFISDETLNQSNQMTEQIVQANNIPVNIQTQGNSNNIVNNALESIINLPIVLIIFSFIFYFVGGYLLYSSLFAGIGGAVDNEADTQQFMLPLTIPLIFALMLAQAIINNHNGPAAFWLSIFPFTSPVIMMIRIPFGVPAWEIALSMVTLILTFIGTTWMAAKIYRIGILVYGKKITYKDLWKWLRFKG